MKILILSNLLFPNEIGGYEIGCKDYTSLLNKMGHETLIATSLDGHLSIRNDKSVRRIFKMFTNFNSAKKKFSYDECEKYNYLVLKKIIEDWKPEKILMWNIQGLGTNIINLIIKSKISFNIFVWDYTYFSYKKRIKDYLFFRFKNKVSNFQYKLLKKKMIFCSKYLQNFYSVSLKENKVLYPFIDFNKIKYNPIFSPKINKLVYVGQIVEHKGIFDVIPDIQSYNQKNDIKLNLTIYSQKINNKNHEYLKKFDFINIRKDIKREQIHKELSNYDIGIFSSKWEEPFGISCLEMLAAGLVVISTCSGGSSEMIINENPVKFDIFKKNDFINKLKNTLMLNNNKSNWNIKGAKKFNNLSIVNQINKIIFDEN